LNSGPPVPQTGALTRVMRLAAALAEAHAGGGQRSATPIIGNAELLLDGRDGADIGPVGMEIAVANNYRVKAAVSI
jgi:hypothetical protein